MPSVDRTGEQNMSTRKNWILFAVTAIFLAAPRAPAAGNSWALKGATVLTAVGPPIENATILVENGKITAVGNNVSIPSGVPVLDVSGKVITPGLVDIHSHIGVWCNTDCNEGAMALGPENRALDTLHMDDPLWWEAVAGGVTTVLTTPGSGERIGGQSITLKTFGSDMKRRILNETGEIKMAVNSRSLSHLADIRKSLLKAREYIEAWDRYEAAGRKGTPPKRDLGKEALAKALRHEVPIRIHIYNANDQMAFLKIKDEFGFDAEFIHSVESYKIADELAKRNVGCIVMPLGLRYSVSDDQMRGNYLLYKAGVKIAFHADHPNILQGTFRWCASMNVHYGMPEDVALKACTIFPAEMSKVNDRVGSIEKGKDADLVVYNGPWYELSTRVDLVFVDGVLAYDRAKDEKEREVR